MTAPETNWPPAYEVLLRTRNLAADDALVLALRSMESEYQPFALSGLLARERDSALAELVSGFDEANEDLRALLIAQAPALAAGVRLCMNHAEFEVRHSALELIRRSGECRLAYLLGEALSHSCRKTVDLAAQTLSELIEPAMRHSRRWASARRAMPRTSVEYLVAAVKRGLASWPLHFRQEVIVSAMRLVDHLEDSIITLAEGSRQNIGHAFNTALDRNEDPALASYCLRALPCERLREAAVRCLARSNDTAFRDSLLDASWLLGDDRIRQSAARIRHIACLQERFPETASGPAGSRKTVRLLVASGLGHATKVGLIQQAASADEVSLKRAAIWALIDHRWEGGDDLLRSIAAHGQDALHRIARIELQRRLGEPFAGRPGGERPTTGLPGSPGPAGTNSGFEPFWKEYDTLPAPDRVRIGKAVLLGEPEFERLLRTKWRKGTSSDRMRALRIISELDLAANFEDEICRSARDVDNVVRSMAVSLLGKLVSTSSRRVLRAATNDPDPRVQANAIEALEVAGDPGMVDQAIHKLESDSSRVRANAIRLLLNASMREGVVGLVEMLASEESADRISALWVIERTHLGGVVEQLRNMAEADPDARVRRRSSRILRQVSDGGPARPGVLMPPPVTGGAVS